MAIDKAIDSSQLDSDLISVANAIRTKGGTSAQLAFPAGFVSAVQAIPTGGGGGYTLDQIMNKTEPSGDIVYTGLMVRDNVLRGHNSLTSFTGNSVTYGIQDDAFAWCENMTSVSFPNAPAISREVFIGCRKLVYAVFPKVKHIDASSFQTCTALEAADFGGENDGLGLYRGNNFNGCTKLTALVIRSSTLWPLNVTTAFSGTPFASGGTGGTLYVPSSLVSTYQGATNWATILGYANNQIKSIESTATDQNAPVDLTTHYIDGSVIPTS